MSNVIISKCGFFYHYQDDKNVTVIIMQNIILSNDNPIFYAFVVGAYLHSVCLL